MDNRRIFATFALQKINYLKMKTNEAIVKLIKQGCYLVKHKKDMIGGLVLLQATLSQFHVTVQRSCQQELRIVFNSYQE